MRRSPTAPASLLLALATAGLAAACAGGAALPTVRMRATYDLDCPEDEIRIEQQIGNRFKAVGCGRIARYRAACDGLRCVVRGDNEPAVPWRAPPEPDDPVRR